MTGAEVRNAIVGPVPEVIRALASHEFFIENIKFGVTRAGDLNAAAKVLLFEYEGKPTPTKKTDLDGFARADIDRQKLELASRKVLDVLDIMTDVFIPRDPLLASAGTFPVYYWFVRNVDDLNRSKLREFLVWIEFAHKKNREAQRLGSHHELIPELSHFDSLNRSTNDLQSHVGRIGVLGLLFIAWLISDANDSEDYFRELSDRSEDGQIWRS